MKWRQVWVLYRTEVRSALREKTIVVNSILMPIFLYPFIMWAAFTGMTFVMGQTEGFESRVLVGRWPREHPQLRRDLEGIRHLKLVEPTPGLDVEEEIRSGSLDARLEFLPAPGEGAALPGNFEARITFTRSKERSEGARDRLREALTGFRDDWLRREAAARGIAAPQWQLFSVQTRNVASGRQMGSLLMGLMLPLFFVIMVAVGCFYPAVDATAGERERSTWETLMSSSASRGAILTAKYLYVASFGFLAGILNLAAMLLTVKPTLGSLAGKSGESLEFAVPLAALPLLGLSAVLLSGFVAAGMMIFASFARTFKEGQSMITPFYLLILVPVLFLSTPGLEFGLSLAVLPVVNVAMMVREALGGAFQPHLIGVTVAVMLAAIALCLRLAGHILHFEDVIVGSYGGSLGKFVQDRIFRRRPGGQRAPEVVP